MAMEALLDQLQDAAGLFLDERDRKAAASREIAIYSCGGGESGILAWLGAKVRAWRTLAACGGDVRRALLETGAATSPGGAAAVEQRVMSKPRSLEHAAEVLAAAEVLGYRWGDGGAVSFAGAPPDATGNPLLDAALFRFRLRTEPSMDRDPGDHRVAAAERAEAGPGMALVARVAVEQYRAGCEGGDEERLRDLSELLRATLVIRADRLFSASRVSGPDAGPGPGPLSAPPPPHPPAASSSSAAAVASSSTSTSTSTSTSDAAAALDERLVAAARAELSREREAQDEAEAREAALVGEVEALREDEARAARARASIASSLESIRSGAARRQICPVCLDPIWDRAAFSCPSRPRHVSACARCAEALDRRGAPCPVCRADRMEPWYPASGAPPAVPGGSRGGRRRPR